MPVLKTVVENVLVLFAGTIVIAGVMIGVVSIAIISYKFIRRIINKFRM